MLPLEIVIAVDVGERRQLHQDRRQGHRAERVDPRWSSPPARRRGVPAGDRSARRRGWLWVFRAIRVRTARADRHLRRTCREDQSILITAKTWMYGKIDILEASTSVVSVVSVASTVHPWTAQIQDFHPTRYSWIRIPRTCITMAEIGANIKYGNEISIQMNIRTGKDT